MSNPYSANSNPSGSPSGYPPYPQSPNTAEMNQQTTDASDPELTKLSSMFWHGAGSLQSAVGNLAGVKSWKESGESMKDWADSAYKEAEEQEQAGQPSWVHGEYNRWRGMVETAIGHITGDPEMEAHARMRQREGNEEIQRSKR